MDPFKIQAHPGMPYARLLHDYGRSKDILAGNAFEVRQYVRMFESGELWQKFGAIEQRHRFMEMDNHLVRYLHNFLAGAVTFADHTRALMGSTIIAKSHRKRYEEKVREVFVGKPIAAFTKALRNYTMHRGLPPSVHTAKIGVTPMQEEWRVTLDVKELSKWDGWTGGARQYLEAHAPQIRLGSLVDEYESLAISFHAWFVGDYIREYGGMINELVALERQLEAGFYQGNPKGSG